MAKKGGEQKLYTYDTVPRFRAPEFVSCTCHIGILWLLATTKKRLYSYSLLPLLIMIQYNFNRLLFG